MTANKQYNMWDVAHPKYCGVVSLKHKGASPFKTVIKVLKSWYSGKYIKVTATPLKQAAEFLYKHMLRFLLIVN